MMPFVITVEKDNNKIILTKEELEEIIEKAYNQGVSDGSTRVTLPIYPTYPSYPSYPYYDTTTAPWKDTPYITITCEA